MSISRAGPAWGRLCWLCGVGVGLCWTDAAGMVEEGWRPRRVTPRLPGPKCVEFHERSVRVLNAGTAGWFLSPVVQERKDGFLIVDLDGNEFIDGISGWGAEPYGPDHPAVREALWHSWRRHGLQISLSVQSPPVLALAERLVSLAPASITRAELSVTETQAVESAVRLMREATGRPIIIVFGPVYQHLRTVDITPRLFVRPAPAISEFSSTFHAL